MNIEELLAIVQVVAPRAYSYIKKHYDRTHNYDKLAIVLLAVIFDKQLAIQEQSELEIKALEAKIDLLLKRGLAD